MKRYDLICIGCGPAGEKAATQAAYYRKSVAIIERAPRPGGAMINTGTIPSKALRETALVCSSLRRRPIPGVECTVAENVSVAQFMAQCHLVQMLEHDRVEASIDRHGIDVYRGFGRFDGPNAIIVDQTLGDPVRLGADHVLIATGSRPYRPDHLDFDHPGIVDADQLLELPRRPKSMIVVGGGVIGSEYACVWAEIGVEVTLIEPRDAVLPFVDPECRELLMTAMKTEGIDLRLNVGLEGAEGLDDGRVRATFTDGSVHEVDVLLFAAGRSGNTEALGLDTIGLAANKRGLLEVDEHYQTPTPGVWAVGDVIGFPALASTSMEQGRIAACNMFDIPFKTELASLVPIGLYTIPTISMIGLSEDEAREKGLDFVVSDALRYRDNARGRMLGDEHGMLKAVFDRKTRTLLGAQIVGEQATELIHLAQSMIIAGEGIDYCIAACFSYPSLMELYKYAAYSALQGIAIEEHRDDELGRRAKVA